MNRILVFLMCSLTVAVCVTADPVGPILDQASYICVTVPGGSCPPTTLEIIVYFDEDVDPVTASDPANYLLHPVDDPEAVIAVQEIFGVWDEESYLFLADLPIDMDYLLTVSGVEDLDGNMMEPGQTAVVVPLENPSPVPEVAAAVPTILPNVPNPFNPVTEVRFVLPDGMGDMAVSVQVHDLAGRLVRRLPVSGRLEPGTHSVTWNGVDDRGRTVGSGTYLVRLKVGDFAAVQKVTLAK